VGLRANIKVSGENVIAHPSNEGEEHDEIDNPVPLSLVSFGTVVTHHPNVGSLSFKMNTFQSLWI
jgi:hypothetical protein